MTLKAKRIFESGSVVKNLHITILLCLSIALLCTSVPASFANSPAFDLIGPQIKMTVTRDSKTLPISRVSDLQPGDKLWIHPEFPDDQSARYLLTVHVHIAACMRYRQLVRMAGGLTDVHA